MARAAGSQVSRRRWTVTAGGRTATAARQAVPSQSRGAHGRCRGVDGGGHVGGVGRTRAEVPQEMFRRKREQGQLELHRIWILPPRLSTLDIALVSPAIVHDTHDPPLVVVHAPDTVQNTVAELIARPSASQGPVCHRSHSLEFPVPVQPCLFSDPAHPGASPPDLVRLPSLLLLALFPPLNIRIFLPGAFPAPVTLDASARRSHP